MVQEALYEAPTAKGGRMEEDEGLTLSENDASLHSLAVGIQIAVVKAGWQPQGPAPLLAQGIELVVDMGLVFARERHVQSSV